MPEPLFFCRVLKSLPSKEIFLLSTKMVARGLIARDAVVGLVESVPGGRRLEILKEILAFVHFELAALLGPVHAFAGLVMQGGSFQLISMSIMLCKALKVHPA